MAISMTSYGVWRQFVDVYSFRRRPPSRAYVCRNRFKTLARQESLHWSIRSTLLVVVHDGGMLRSLGCCRYFHNAIMSSVVAWSGRAFLVKT